MSTAGSLSASISRSGDAASHGYWEGISGRDGSQRLTITRAGLAWVAEAQAGAIKAVAAALNRLAEAVENPRS